MNFTQLNILVADDDTFNYIFFREAILELVPSSNVESAYDGQQLMQLLNKETHLLPHILFLNLNISIKNGFECLMEIKQNNHLKNLPVVLYSKSLSQDVVNLMYEKGALYFIRKPAEFPMFKKIILHTLSLIIKKMPSPAGKPVLQPAKKYFVLTAENSFT